VAEGEGGAHPTQMHKKKEKSGWKAPKKQQHYELRYNGGKRQMSGREKGGLRGAGWSAGGFLSHFGFRLVRLLSLVVNLQQQAVGAKSLSNNFYLMFRIIFSRKLEIMKNISHRTRRTRTQTPKNPERNESCISEACYHTI